MSDRTNLEGRGSEEQESRALLPASREQQRVVHGGDRTHAHAEPSAQAEDLSTLNERDIWRHFESTKRSAIFHLDQYFHHREAVLQEQGAGESASLDLSTMSPPAISLRNRRPADCFTVSQNEAPAPRSYWDFKVARDNLLNELGLLNGLLEHMSNKSSKGLAPFYGIIVLLCVLLSSQNLEAASTLKGIVFLFQR